MMQLKALSQELAVSAFGNMNPLFSRLQHVKNDILIFNYKIGDEKGCGKTTFSGNRMLIEQIKKIA